MCTIRDQSLGTSREWVSVWFSKLVLESFLVSSQEKKNSSVLSVLALRLLGHGPGSCQGPCTKLGPNLHQPTPLQNRRVVTQMRDSRTQAVLVCELGCRQLRTCGPGGCRRPSPVLKRQRKRRRHCSLVPRIKKTQPLYPLIHKTSFSNNKK